MPLPRTLSRRRPRSRGYSLLEILVVLAIVALLSSVVAISLLKWIPQAKIDTTRTSAQALRSAVGTYRIHHDTDCPSIDDLVADDVIDRASKRTDAWDQPFVIQCDEGHHVTVVSAGPDKKLDTADDIRVPEPVKVADRH